MTSTPDGVSPESMNGIDDAEELPCLLSDTYLGDLSPETKKLMEQIPQCYLAKPPIGSFEDRQLVKAWKRVISHELDNPQGLDSAQHQLKMINTYNKALEYLLYFPEIWHMYAMYMKHSGSNEDFKNVYKEALKKMPNNLILSFKLCDILEDEEAYGEVDDIYGNLLSQGAHPLVWIQYMYFTRRVYSNNKAREVFFRARQSENCCYQVYVAAALMEFYVNKEEKVARNIFELGLKRYSQDVPFLLQYVEFLIHRNEENDMRVLFEKILKNFKIPKSEIWNLFLKFEGQCGTLETSTKVIKRRSEAYPKLDPSGLFGMVQRYRFLDLWPCSHIELSSFAGFDQHMEQEAYEEEEEQEGEAEEEMIGDKYVMPDLFQLSVYKKDTSSIKTYVLSKSLSQFMNSLPTASQWDGPTVNVDKLLESIKDLPLQLQNAASATNVEDEEEERDDRRTRRKGTIHDAFARKMLSKMR